MTAPIGKMILKSPFNMLLPESKVECPLPVWIVRHIEIYKEIYRNENICEGGGIMNFFQ